MAKFGSGGVGGAEMGSLAKLNASPEAIRVLPFDFVKRHRVLPIRNHKGILHVATSEPGNQRVIDDIRLFSGLEVEESERRRENCWRRLPSVTR